MNNTNSGLPVERAEESSLQTKAQLGLPYKNGAGGVKSVWQDFTPPVKLNKKNPFVFKVPFDSFDNRLNKIAESEYNKTLDKLLGKRMIAPLRGKYA